MDVKEVFYKFCTNVVGNGRNTLFWEDNWIGGKPLAEQFRDLYNITLTKKITVADVKQVGIDSIKFRRDVLGNKLLKIKQSWSDLVLEDGTRDTLRWNLTKDGKFTVKSFHTALKMQQVIFPHKKIWGLKVPLKIKIFIWMFTKNKILTKDNLFKRGWRKGKANCQFCDQTETLQPLFYCPLARLLWNIVKCALNINSVLNRQDLFGSWMNKIDKFTKKLVVVGLAAIIWTIWKFRNKACFEKKLPADPTDLVFMACSLVDSWATLQKQEGSRRNLQLGARLLKQVKSTARVRIECRLALEHGNEDNLSLSIAVRVHRGRYSGRHGEGKWSGGGRRGAASQRHGWRGRGGCADGWYQFHRARSIAEHLVIGSALMFAGETRRCQPGQIFF
uniref:OSJNBa0029L02.10 protein n=1 Tax=Oryza sativa subsp. japonica TaxID=39947 RepID=Q7XMS7_ORYSJ|nr:OSJNBa0029L02.10 [Oryza sativa Japonica Group]